MQSSIIEKWDFYKYVVHLEENVECIGGIAIPKDPDTINNMK